MLQRGVQRLEEGQAGGPVGSTDLHGDGGLGAAPREDGGLVQEVGQVGAAEAGHPHGDGLQVHILRQLLVLRMHLGVGQQKYIYGQTHSQEWDLLIGRHQLGRSSAPVSNIPSRIDCVQQRTFASAKWDQEEGGC